MKKFFVVLILGVYLILASNPIKAIENNNGFVGIVMHKFPKGKIIKEVVIIDVIPSSPAWNAGIRIADRILKVNGEDVSRAFIDFGDFKENAVATAYQSLVNGKIPQSTNDIFYIDGVKSLHEELCCEGMGE